MLTDHPSVVARLNEDLLGWLTTVDEAGQPQASPIWFVIDGDDLHTNGHDGSRRDNTTTRSTAPSTSAPSSTTTSTVVEWTVKTTATNGGTVVVKYRPDEVVLQAASPAAGFRVEVDKVGPPEVDVEFESETLKVEYRARRDHGELKIEISESEDN